MSRSTMRPRADACAPVGEISVPREASTQILAMIDFEELVRLSPARLPAPEDPAWRAVAPRDRDQFAVCEREVSLALVVPLFEAMSVEGDDALRPPAHAAQWPGLTVPAPLRLVVDPDGWYRVILRWQTGDLYIRHVRTGWARARMLSQGRLGWWLFCCRRFLRRRFIGDGQLQAELTRLWCMGHLPQLAARVAAGRAGVIGGRHAREP
jgi:hypothetical protein